MGGSRVTAEDFDRVPCLDGARALKRDLLAIHKMKETDPSKIKEQMKLYHVRANAKLEDDELRKVTEKLQGRRRGHGLGRGRLSVAVISDDDVSDDDDGFDSDDGDDGEDEQRRRGLAGTTLAPPEPSGSSAADAKKAEVVAQMDAALASTARVEPGDRPNLGCPSRPSGSKDPAREKTVELRGKGTAKVHAWVFEDVIVYETFIPYEHPRGAVGWIDLTKAVVERPQIALSTVENHDDIAAIKASGFSSKKAASGKVKVPDKFQSSASRLCGIFELNVKQRKAFLNFAEARGNKTKAGGLGSSASLSTDNDDERLELCNEMGVLGRKVAAGVLAVATFESVRPGQHEIVVGLEAGFVENVPAFFGTPPCDFIISQLKKKGYNVLVHVRVPMTQLKIPSLRERTILRFWRAAPGETPKVTVRKRLVVS
ncbi:hypothetical protein JL720_12537 [Aureococcus anophagefferens]|nr:hypothetical protein JL720_12537 [Aureococcus anophagefferens]